MREREKDVTLCNTSACVYKSVIRQHNINDIDSTVTCNEQQEKRERERNQIKPVYAEACLPACLPIQLTVC